MRTQRVVIIGAGVGGLVAGLRLASHGFDVTIVESAATPGGKLRQTLAGGVAIDAGPTVFTMRRVFQEILEECGLDLAQLLTLRPVDCLARHAWSESQRLDLFADTARSTEAIGDFAGRAAAEGYLAFCRRADAIYKTLQAPFIDSSRPTPAGLVARVGLGRLGELMRISPFTTLWSALGEHFHDERLRQLFGRYATYCGSSPFQSPATLMLVAHVEKDGVWLVEGGMYRVAEMLEKAIIGKGAVIRYGEKVIRILVENGRASGVELASGERVPADAVVMNGDVAALAEGLLGDKVRGTVAPADRAARSLSAITWAMPATTAGFPLLRHNVFFSSDYRAEFDDIFSRARLPRNPTVYVCAQDRTDHETASGPDDRERLLCLVNAPATGDHAPCSESELRQCEEATFALLQRCGLQISREAQATVRTAPAHFAQLFPATGGALYGRASHGWMASFARPGATTRLPGLFLAGGSVHPGPGVPMAALSGRQAALAAMTDLASISRSPRAAMAGGMSMR